jgi:hypothetical protein
MGGGPATLRTMTSSTILTSAFLTAAVANLLFFTGLGGFVLLPLHLRGLGATDAQVGLIMACFSATAIVVQPPSGGRVGMGYTAPTAPRERCERRGPCGELDRGRWPWWRWWDS